MQKLLSSGTKTQIRHFFCQRVTDVFLLPESPIKIAEITSDEKWKSTPQFHRKVWIEMKIDSLSSLITQSFIHDTSGQNGQIIHLENIQNFETTKLIWNTFSNGFRYSLQNMTSSNSSCDEHNVLEFHLSVGQPGPGWSNRVGHSLLTLADSLSILGSTSCLDGSNSRTRGATL